MGSAPAVSKVVPSVTASTKLGLGLRRCQDASRNALLREKSISKCALQWARWEEAMGRGGGGGSVWAGARVVWWRA